MQGTVAQIQNASRKQSLLRSFVQPQLKPSDIEQNEKQVNGKITHPQRTQIRTIVVNDFSTSENILKQNTNKPFKKPVENITRPAIKLQDVKKLVRTNSRSSKKQNIIVKFNSPQHTNHINKALVNQPPRIAKEGMITHIQPPSVIKSSTMQNLNYNPEKLFKICQEDAVDKLFLKSKESIIRSAKTVEVQDLNESLNFWKVSNK